MGCAQLAVQGNNRGVCGTGLALSPLDCPIGVCCPPGNGGAGPGGWQPFFTPVGQQFARLVVMHTELMQALSARLTVDGLQIEAPKSRVDISTLKPAAKAQNGKQ